MGMIGNIRDLVSGRGQVDAGQEEEARQKMAQAVDDRTPASKFGVAMGNSLAGRSDQDLRRMLPGIDGSEDLPRGPQARRERIYSAAKTMANLHIEGGDNYGLGSEIGRAARRKAIIDLSDPGRDDVRKDDRTPLGSLVDRHSKQSGEDVRRYLSVSHESEAMIRESARIAVKVPSMQPDVDRLEKGFGLKPIQEANDPERWMALALRLEQGYARSGAMPAAEVVDIATSRLHSEPRRTYMEGPAPSPSMPNLVKGSGVQFGSDQMRAMSVKASGPLDPSVAERLEQREKSAAIISERVDDRIAQKRGPTMADTALRAAMSLGR